MNDAQLLERLSATDPCGEAAPSQAWEAQRASAEVERLVAPPSASGPAWRGWRVAVAMFAVVLLIGVGLALLSRSAADDPPVTNTTALPVTTSAPPTTQPSALPISPETESLIRMFIDAYNDGDPLAAPLAPDARLLVVSPGDTGEDPAEEPAAAHIDAAAIFEETIELGECLQVGDAISCEVLLEDLFTEHLDLEPAVQRWEFDIAESVIAAVRIDPAGGVIVAAMGEFDSWLMTRGFDSVLAAEGAWVRSEATAELTTSRSATATPRDRAG